MGPFLYPHHYISVIYPSYPFRASIQGPDRGLRGVQDLSAAGQLDGPIDQRVQELVLPQKGNRGADAGVRGARSLARLQILQAELERLHHIIEHTP